MANPVEALRTLNAHGMRRTRACRSVLAVLDPERGLTARQVRDRLVVTGEEYDLTTVYRVLRRLAAAGALQTVPCAAGVGYRHASTRGAELVCLTCGCTAPLSQDAVALLAREAKLSGFAVDAVVTGYCRGCADSR